MKTSSSPRFQAEADRTIIASISRRAVSTSIVGGEAFREQAPSEPMAAVASMTSVTSAASGGTEARAARRREHDIANLGTGACATYGPARSLSSSDASEAYR